MNKKAKERKTKFALPAMKPLTDDYWELHKLAKELMEIRNECPQRQSRQLNPILGSSPRYIRITVKRAFKMCNYSLIDI